MSNKFSIHYKTAYSLITAGLSDDSLLLYIGIKSLCNKNVEEIPLHFESLYYLSYGEFIETNKNKTREYKHIKTALEDLERIKLINIKSEHNKMFVLDVKNMTESSENDNYFAIFDLQKLHSAIKEKSKKIIRYLFCYLHMKDRNDSNWFFISNRSNIAAECCMDVKTVDSYNECLIKNKIIYIHSYNGYQYSDTKNYVNNCYGLYQDRKKIKDECKKFINKEIKNGNVRRITWIS